jgi:hypothetical protein
VGAIKTKCFLFFEKAIDFMYKQLKPHLNTFFIFLAVVGAAAILSRAYLNRNKHANRIYVTGSGSHDFKSDLGKWSGSYSVENIDLQEGYKRLQENRAAVLAFLKNKGFKEGDITFSSVSTEKNYHSKYDEHGNLLSRTFMNHTLAQEVSVNSKDVDLIAKISREATELINQGIEINSNPPTYYYTRLTDLKIKMVAAATEDGRIRAEQIAENGRGSLGGLMNANLGVFQITSQSGDDDYSWGGTYNTSSIYKTASITVRLEFGVN